MMVLITVCLMVRCALVNDVRVDGMMHDWSTGSSRLSLSLLTWMIAILR